jgi:hypothetical protein
VSSYLHAACIAVLFLSARVQASQHIRPRAHGPGTRISQQLASFTEIYLGLTAKALPGSYQMKISTAPSRTRRSCGSRVTTRSVSRALCGPSMFHYEPRHHRTGARPLLPAALASMPYGLALVRVRVPNSRPTAPRFSTNSRQYLSEGRREDGKVCQCRIRHLW